MAISPGSKKTDYPTVSPAVANSRTPALLHLDRFAEASSASRLSGCAINDASSC